MKDETQPAEGEKWEFDEKVAACFDDMLARSIPDYETMRALVFKIGRRYVRQATEVVDIGSSNGNAIAPFVSRFGAANTFKCLEISEPMIANLRKRFAGLIDAGVVSVLSWDLRTGVPEMFASLILSILTVQFTPIEHRKRILEGLYRGLVPGGALIYVEKVLGETYDLDRMLVAEYYDMKRENCYTEEQIAAKRKSLEGVLVPITAAWNVDMLHAAGFRQVECFWRFLNFAGWVAVK